MRNNPSREVGHNLIAHRGAVLGTKIPENSLFAFSRAMDASGASGASSASGASGTRSKRIIGIECDLRKTKDGVIVVVHDEDINGVLVADMTCLEIQQQNRNVCTLQELLHLAKKKNYLGVLNLEMKEYNLYTLVFQEIRQWLDLNILMTSFLHTEIKGLYSLGCSENVKFGLLYGSFPSNAEDLLQNNIYVTVLSDKVIPPQEHYLFQLLKKYSEKVYIYTVNDKEKIDIYSECGFRVITDNINCSI